MNKDTFIRKGLPEDSEDFGRLLALSASSLLPAFGTNGNQTLRSLFSHKRNLFGFEHSHFIEVNGRNAGMILGYDGRVERQEGVRTGLLLLRYMKVGLVTQLPILLRVNWMFSRIGEDEYYISNIAVYPSYKGLGLATQLLTLAEEVAKGVGAKRIVLDVEANSQEATKLYIKLGYIGVEKARKILVCSQPYTFSRMAKVISNAATTDITADNLSQVQ